jgi:molybdate transport system ATP-binding protein
VTLDVDIRHPQGAFLLEARFRSSGSLTALFGPSGSGKTSLVRAIAGLIVPDEARIVVNGRVLVDRQAGIFVPGHRRRVGIVFQDARLFPHLSVRANLLFGRWFTPRRERRTGLAVVTSLLGIEHLLDRGPGHLSGGEKQRVAIGRALLADPQILLLDEPLASLDESRKSEIMPYLERLRDEAGLPIVLVSHSVAEIARLATHVVVLSEGRVTASGPTAEILQHPRLFPNAGPAEAGALIETRVLAHDEAYDLTMLQARAGSLTVPRVGRPVGSVLRVRLRARDVMLSLSAPRDLSALNVLPGRILALEASDASAVDVTLDCAGDIVVAHLTRKSVDRLGLRPGLTVHAVIKSVAFDAETFGAASDPGR